MDALLFRTHLAIPTGGICVSYTVLQQQGADSCDLALLLPVEPPDGISGDISPSSTQCLALAGKQRLAFMQAFQRHDWVGVPF